MFWLEATTFPVWFETASLGYFGADRISFCLEESHSIARGRFSSQFPVVDLSVSGCGDAAGLDIDGSGWAGLGSGTAGLDWAGLAGATAGLCSCGVVPILFCSWDDG